MLLEDGLLAIVDFLSGRDMKHLYLTNSVFCRIAERVARTKVEAVNMEFPTGPIKIKNDFFREKMAVAEGRNSFGLRAPEDCKSWVGVFNYLEKFTSDAFYFRFQIMAGDTEAASRYLQSPDKFAFGPRFVQGKEADALESSPIHPMEKSFEYRLSVIGGLLHLGGVVCGDHFSRIVAGDKTLDSGVYQIICRFYYPFPCGNRRGIVDQTIGSFGILCRKYANNLTWVHRVPILALYRNDSDIVGLKYDASTRRLSILRFRHGPREGNRMNLTTVTIESVNGELMFAAEVTPKGMEVEQALLSIRECNSEEWEMLCDHISYAPQ